MAYHGFDISGKVCLVTGGTSGIGRAIALGFAQAGAKVVAGSTNPEKVTAMEKELGEGHAGVQMDVGDAQSVKSAVEFAIKKFGRIDVLVNAAGVTKLTPSLELAQEDFERILRINLTGTFLACQAVARVMKEQSPDAQGLRGAIVNIASLSSFVGLTRALAYGCSKAAVMHLTQSLANEWAELGIRVNAIAPGVFPTELNRKLIEGTPRGEWFKKHTPMGRFGNTEELVGGGHLSGVAIGQLYYRGDDQGGWGVSGEGGVGE